MIRFLTINNLGPHDHFYCEFDPHGVTRISGPSEIGKTTIIEALLFAFWGRSNAGKFRAEQIRDGADGALVEVELDTGEVIRRSITRARTQQRSIIADGSERRFSSEAKFAAALGPLGVDPELGSLILSPQGWIELIAANARAFRDVLTRVLPDGDLGGVVARLMQARGYDVAADEANASEKEVMALRRGFKKSLGQQEGRRDAALELIDRLSVETPREPATEELAQAQDVLSRAEQWRAFDAWTERYQRSETQLEGWRAQFEALGTTPAYDFDQHAASATREQKAKQRHEVAASTLAFNEPRADAAQAELRRFEEAGDACPVCAREGWSDARAALEQARTQATSAQQQLIDARAEAAQAQAEYASARDSLARAVEQAEAWRAWHASYAALGDTPALPALEMAPQGARPNDSERGWAAEALKAHQSELGARRQREETLAQSRLDVATHVAEIEHLSGCIARSNALLDVVREAPSVQLQEQAEALGELGPVSLRFGDNPAVSVWIDERPWWLASQGRLVVADMWLRAALRRVSQVPASLLCVDNVTNVGGQPLADIGGPVVLLETTNGAEISVERSTPRLDE